MTAQIEMRTARGEARFDIYEGKLIIDGTEVMVESMGDIIPRTSQLNLGVRLSPHPASDVLSL
ncbi:MAG: aspartyl protease, partial [Nostoc sp.]